MNIKTNTKQLLKTIMKLLDCASLEELNQLVSKHNYVMIDFKASWCGPCKSIFPQVQYLQHQRNDVMIVTVDADEGSEICNEYKVTSLPTFTFFVNGQVVDQFSSADVNKLVSLFNKHFPIVSNVPQETVALDLPKEYENRILKGKNPTMIHFEPQTTMQTLAYITHKDEPKAKMQTLENITFTKDEPQTRMQTLENRTLMAQDIYFHPEKTKKLTTLQKIHAARSNNNQVKTTPLPPHDEENITVFPMTTQSLSLKEIFSNH